MNIPDEELQQVIRQFERLDSALIDASSMIYMNRAGFLETLQQTIDLCSIPEIVAETGREHAGIRRIACPDHTLSPDEKLVACALATNLPIISEDKQILNRMKREGRPYFNALIMLNFLFYKRRIDAARYYRHVTALREIAWYSRRVWIFGEKLAALIAEAVQEG